MDYMENLVRDFRDLRTEEEFGSYLANSDKAFEDLLTMGNQTRDRVMQFNTQQLIKDMIQKNGQLEGSKEENKEED